MPSLNDLKERLSQLNRRTAKANDIWKPKEEHVIRLLRYPHGDDPFIPLHFHYEIGDNPSILCPKANFGEECVICNFCDLLKSWKTPQGDEKKESDRKQDWELFKKIQPKARVFVAMVERGKEADGAKFWGITPNQAEALLGECTDGDRLSALGIAADDANRALDVLFGKKAFDLNVAFAKPGEKGNTKQFGQVTVKARIVASPVCSDPTVEKNLLASIKKMTDVYPKMASAEVEKIFKKFTGSNQSEAQAAGGTEKYGGKKEETAAAPTNAKENAKLAGSRSIDEAFGDMLSETDS